MFLSACGGSASGQSWECVENLDLIRHMQGDSEILPLHRNVSTTGVPGPDNCASIDTIAHRHIRSLQPAAE